MHPSELNLQRAAYSVREALEFVPFGRTTLFSLIKSGQLPARKRGKNTIILAPDLAKYLSRLEPVIRQRGTAERTPEPTKRKPHTFAK